MKRNPSQKGHMFLYEKIKYYFGLGKLIFFFYY